MSDNYLKDLRKQLLAGGYYPLPGLDKACRLKGWNGAFLEAELAKYGSLPAAVDSWDRRFPNRLTTNVQIRDGLVAIDMDVDDPGLAAAFADILRHATPDVFDHAPVRFGSGEYKAAWFCRLADGEELFVRRGSRKFIQLGGDRADYHHVEVFGGKPTAKGTVSRQFGCFGPHSPGLSYSWADGDTLAEVALAGLPVITGAGIWEILHAFEEAAAADGCWEPLADRQGDHEGEAHAVWDIDRERTRFDTRDYGWMSYAELEQAVGREGKVYCQASFIGDEKSVSNRCAAFWSDKYRCTMVQDWATSAFHLPSDLKPTPRLLPAPPPPVTSPPPSGAGPAGQISGPLTQDAVARAFAELYEGRLRFCHHAGAWYEWDGLRWKRDEKQRGFQFCRELARTKSRAAPTVTETREIQRVSFAGGVEKYAKGDFRLAVTSEQWDRDPWLLGTPEGTLELQSGRVRASRPEEGITRLTAVAPLHGAPTPVWDRFLMETFEGDLDLIRFNRQWFGYSLTGDVSEHALWFGYGSGGNGKGVLINTIAAVMGDYAGTAPMETFTAKNFDSHPTEIAMLRGMRMVTASETEEGRAWAESRIKQLTGGDPVTARFMHKDFFTYGPQFKLSLAGNHKPRLKNVDGAVRRRFRLVPFLNNVPLELQDRKLQEKLRAEYAGIMQWLVEGCLDWQRNGLVIPDAVTRATDGYFEEQDVMGQWLADECEVNRNAVTASGLLFTSWVRFANAAGYPPGAKNIFVMELGRRGFEQVRAGHAQTRSIKGLKLKTTPNLQIVPTPPEVTE